MVHINDLFDEYLFKQMIEQGYIRRQFSEDGNLAILNYTERAQFDRMWNEVTLNCRGLIFDVNTGQVIARGFKKFFNWDDSSQPYPPKGTVLRMPKMDGSLGILYWDDEEWKIATRGSFTSDQALKATRMFEHTRVKNFNAHSWEQPIQPSFDRSYLFEIIFPENRIVVDYGQDERLVLLDVLDTATGKSDMAEFDEFIWPDKVEKILIPEFKDTMGSEIPSGEEGFVFYWPARDFRVKMKAAEYIELHRMIFGLSARSVWQRMGEGETIEEIAERLPDEFHDWVRKIGNDLKLEQSRIMKEAAAEYSYVRSHLPANYVRREFAEKAIKSPLKSYLFLLEDGKDISTEVWKSLKPAGNIGIKTISEDTA
jgi:RNA ligase